MDKEKLDYLTDHTAYYISEHITEVLEDEEEEVSAVTLNNIIICFLGFLKDTGKDAPLSVCDLFISLGFDKNDFANYEKKRIAEAKYISGNNSNNISLSA